MVVGVFGVPSLSTTLGAEIVRALLASFYGACELVSPANSEDVKGLWTQNTKSVVVYSELPEKSLIRSLFERRVPVIVFLNGLAATARGLVAERGKSALEAIRAASLSFAALRGAVSEESVLIVSSHNQINNVYDLLQRMTQFLGIQASPDTIAATMKSLNFSKYSDGGVYLEGQSAKALPNVKAAAIPNPTVIAQVDTLSSGLQDYDQLVERRYIHTLTWPGTIFHLLDKDAGPAIESVDLLGPARYLVSGPFMGLPRGTWLATIAFSVANNMSGNKIMFDVAAAFGADIVTKAECNLPEKGDFLAEFEFHHVKPHLPLELRSFLMQGAIEGRFSFKNVIFRLQ